MCRDELTDTRSLLRMAFGQGDADARISTSKTVHGRLSPDATEFIQKFSTVRTLRQRSIRAWVGPYRGHARTLSDGAECHGAQVVFSFWATKMGFFQESVVSGHKLRQS